MANRRKQLEKKAAQEREEERVCGPRIMRKVNKFIQQMNQVAGLETVDRDQVYKRSA